MYGSPSSQSGGVAAMSMGESCEDVDALERLGDMCRGVCVERMERMECSEDVGEPEFHIRACCCASTGEDAYPMSVAHPYWGVGSVTGEKVALYDAEMEMGMSCGFISSDSMMWSGCDSA